MSSDLPELTIALPESNRPMQTDSAVCLDRKAVTLVHLGVFGVGYKYSPHISPSKISSCLCKDCASSLSFCPYQHRQLRLFGSLQFVTMFNCSLKEYSEGLTLARTSEHQITVKDNACRRCPRERSVSQRELGIWTATL